MVFWEGCNVDESFSRGVGHMLHARETSRGALFVLCPRGGKGGVGRREIDMRIGC